MQDAVAQNAGRDLVFSFSYLSWQAVARRGWFGTEDRLARGLLEHERIARLLVCDLVRSLPALVAREVMDRRRGNLASFPSSSSARLLRPVRLRREYPTSIAGVERACAAFDRAARRAAREMGLTRPAVIVAHPLLAGFAEFDWAGPVTFFATDDWLAYAPQRPWWPAYEESYARVRERGRRVGAVSAPALERIAPTGPHAIVPNGLDPSEWLENPASPPDWARGERKPLLVYAGTLDARLDVGALLELARTMPDARIVLVGPLLDTAHLAPLRVAANVEIQPPLGRRELIAVIREADVGLIPHRDLALTRAMSPLKLYEYLAAGLPVVAADLPPVRDVDAGVFLVQAGDSYADATAAALARGRTEEYRRRDFIARHSWGARHDKVLDLALA